MSVGVSCNIFGHSGKQAPHSADYLLADVIAIRIIGRCCEMNLWQML